MVVQYPDEIVITRAGGSVQDENGNWVTTPSEEITIPCRFVPNGAGKSVALADGTNYVFTYRIAFPVGTENVKEQDVYTRGSETGIIKRFEIGQLHSVAWV